MSKLVPGPLGGAGGGVGAGGGEVEVGGVGAAAAKEESMVVVVQVVYRILPHTRNFSRDRSGRAGGHRGLAIGHRENHCGRKHAHLLVGCVLRSKCICQHHCCFFQQRALLVGVSTTQP